MSRRNQILDDESILEAMNESDFGEDSDDDENWLPPDKENEDDSEYENSDDNASTPVIATPANNNIWTKRMFRSKPMPSVTENDFEEVITPSEYFEKYFTEDVYELFALHTNMYYQTAYNEVLKTHRRRTRRWHVQKKKMAWLQRFKLTYITDAMSRERFFMFRRNLHIVDKASISAQEMSRNRLWLVQPLIDAVRSRCLQLSRNYGTYSIDEQMVPFLGKCPVRQFVPGKPRPVGLKNFVITSKGLVLDFEVYQGDTTPFPDKSLGLGPAVVLRLITTIPKGSFAFFDRYFTTIPLLEKMVVMYSTMKNDYCELLFAIIIFHTKLITCNLKVDNM